MENKVLTIAGFDPSAGAGLLADIKTFEQLEVYGLAVNTVNTVQTEDSFLSVDWIALDLILRQTKVLLQRYSISHVKIGLLKNFSHLLRIVVLLREFKVAIIVWDPILKSSTGYDFHEELNSKELKSALEIIHFTTPNLEEYQILKPYLKGREFILTGGHTEEDWVEDRLFYQEKEFHFSRPKLAKTKHGTGCIFSSAFLAYLAKGEEVSIAVKLAGEYIHKALQSSSDLLTKHYKIKPHETA